MKIGSCAIAEGKGVTSNFDRSRERKVCPRGAGRRGAGAVRFRDPLRKGLKRDEEKDVDIARRYTCRPPRWKTPKAKINWAVLDATVERQGRQYKERGTMVRKAADRGVADSN